MAHRHPHGLRALLCLWMIALAPELPAALPGEGVEAEASSGSQDYFEEATRLLQRGDRLSATIQLKNALQADPGHLSSRILLGNIYLQQGLGDAAEQELRRALRAGADVALVLAPLADAYFLQRKFKEVLTDFKVVDPFADDAALITSIRGDAHFQLREFEQAERAFRDAMSMQPDLVEPYLGMVRLLMSRGDVVEAEDFVDAASAVEPQRAQVWFLKGEIRRLKQDKALALEHYTRAIELKPSHFPARNARAAILVEQGEIGEARVDVESVLAALPGDPQALYLDASIKQRTGDRRGASESLKAAGKAVLAIDPLVLQRDPAMLLLAGVINYSLRNLVVARQHLEHFVDLRPYHPGARRLLAEMLLEEGDSAQAVSVLLPAVGLAREDPELLVLLGRAYLAEGKYEEALELLEEARALVPMRPELETLLAMGRLAEGQTEAAMRNLESAVGGGGAAVRAGMLLTLLYLRDGNLAQARETAGTLVARMPRDPALLNLVGSVEMAAGNDVAARSSFLEALRLSPGFPPALHNMARLERNAGNPRKARGMYEDILEHHPKDVRAMAELARLDRAEGRAPEAIQWLEKARATDPDAVQAQLLLVQLYLDVGELDQAASRADELAQRRETDAEVLGMQARVHLAQGKPARAGAIYRRMSRLSTGGVGELAAIARSQVTVNDFEGARWSLRKAAQLDPESILVGALQADVSLRTGRLEEAMEIAEALSARHPQDPTGDLLMGDVLMRLDRHAEAESRYAAALARHEATDLVVRLSRAKSAQGRSTEAVEDLRRWRVRHPDDEEATRALAVALLQAGRYEAARALHEELANAGPDDANILNNLAWIYFRLGDDRMLPTAMRAHALAPTSAAVNDTMGWLLVQNNQAARALRYLREARSRASKDPQIGYHLAVALHELGRDEECIDELRRVLDSERPFDEGAQASALLHDLTSGRDGKEPS